MKVYIMSTTMKLKVNGNVINLAIPEFLGEIGYSHLSDILEDSGFGKMDGCFYSVEQWQLERLMDLIAVIGSYKDGSMVDHLTKVYTEGADNSSVDIFTEDHYGLSVKFLNISNGLKIRMSFIRGFENLMKSRNKEIA